MVHSSTWFEESSPKRCSLQMLLLATHMKVWFQHLIKVLIIKVLYSVLFKRRLWLWAKMPKTWSLSTSPCSDVSSTLHNWAPWSLPTSVLMSNLHWKGCYCSEEAQQGRRTAPSLQTPGWRSTRCSSSAHIWWFNLDYLLLARNEAQLLSLAMPLVHPQHILEGSLR